MDLSIIIVNYNSSGFLEGCLRSIFDSIVGIDYEVVVVDNNSSDGGLPRLKDRFRRAKFIELNENKGFAAGNNVGIKDSHGKNILLLNPDTMVEKNAMQGLYDRLNADERIGMVGPKIFYSDGSMQSKVTPKRIPTIFYIFCELFYLDKLFFSSEIFNSYFGANFDYQKTQDVETLCGACIMMKRDMFNVVGPLDEKFFLYFEETDLCCRALKSGFRILYVPDCSIVHYKAKSSSTMKRPSVGFYYESQSYFFYKHYGVTGLVILYGLNIIGMTFRLAFSPIYILKDRDFEKPKRFLWALLYHLNLFNIRKGMK